MSLSNLYRFAKFFQCYKENQLETRNRKRCLLEANAYRQESAPSALKMTAKLSICLHYAEKRNNDTATFPKSSMFKFIIVSRATDRERWEENLQTQCLHNCIKFFGIIKKNWQTYLLCAHVYCGHFWTTSTQVSLFHYCSAVS